MKKTKILILALSLIVASLMLTSCRGLDKERTGQIKEDTNDLYSSVNESFINAKDITTMFGAIISFADENQIYYKEIKDDALVLIKQGAATSTDTEDVVLHCDVSLEAKEASSQKVAIILAALKNVQNDGKVTAVFTANKNGEYTGANSLPQEYIKTDNLISLSYDEDSTMYKDSAALNDYFFNKNVTKETLGSKRSYRITITGVPSTPSSETTKDCPNAVTTLTNLLASCEGSDLNYNVISFKSTGSPNSYPSSATLEVAVDSSDYTKFQTKVTNSIEKFTKDYIDGEESPYTYTIQNISTPTQGVSKADMTELLSMIYTLDESFDDINKDDNEDNVGKNNITKLNITTNSMRLIVSSRYVDSAYISSARSTFSDLAALNDFTFVDNKISDFWAPDENSELITSFKDSATREKLTLKTIDTYRSGATGVFNEKNPGISQIAIGTNIKVGPSTASTIVDFIEDLNSNTL